MCVVAQLYNTSDKSMQLLSVLRRVHCYWVRTVHSAISTHNISLSLGHLCELSTLPLLQYSVDQRLG